MAASSPRRSLFLPFRPGQTVDGYLGFARQVEAAGWEGIWINEVVEHDPYQLLALVARQTSTLQLGTSIATWTRTIPTMAASTSTIDLISGGRFRLGLGTMPKAWNEDWHGIDSRRIVRRMREYVEALRVAWTAAPGRPVSYEGELIRLREMPRRTAAFRSRIPIYLGISGDQLLRLAGEIADGVLLHSCYTTTTLRDVTLPMLAIGAARAGRSVSSLDTSATLSCVIDRDRSQALHWARAQVSWYATFPYNAWVFEHMGWQATLHAVRQAAERGDRAAMIDAVPDEVATSIVLAGTADEVRAMASRVDGLVDLPRFSTPTECPLDVAEHNLAHILDVFSPR